MVEKIIRNYNLYTERHGDLLIALILILDRQVLANTETTYQLEFYTIGPEVGYGLVVSAREQSLQTLNCAELFNRVHRQLRKILELFILQL